MSDPFDWQIGEEDDELPAYEQKGQASRGYWIWSLLILVGTAVAGSLIFGGYQAGEHQAQQIQDTVGSIIQGHIDLQAQAVQRGDGEFFFGLHADNSSWRAAQLLPANQNFYKGNPQVTRIQEEENLIWASVSATVDGRTVSRIMFFSQENQELKQIPTDSQFWGKVNLLPTSWGELHFHDADAVWAEEIDLFVEEIIAKHCAVTCLENKTTFQLDIAPDFWKTAVANEVRVPSPRLLAINSDGEPDQMFWDALENEIVQQITPALIKFGIPDVRQTQLMDYEGAAAAFMAEHPHITIELVPINSSDANTIQIDGLDGATVLPSESMLASGQIFNLSNYLLTDESFNHTDFYSQIWKGAWWQEQFWMVPQGGELRLVYYDRDTYQHINQPEPSLRWTWDELARDMALFSQGDVDTEWGFLDAGNDALFSYAYNWNSGCSEQTGNSNCQDTLDAAAIEAALEWYTELAGEPGHIPDMSRLKLELPTSIYDEEARISILANWQSAQRRSAIWVDGPHRFEREVFLGPTGVVPFPGSEDKFDGVTPLWVHGHVVFQQSERPLATWQWISYLSTQPLASQFRYLPARSSVATETNYWSTLPIQLSDPIRTAIPFARPVLIEELEYFDWELIISVVSGELTPAQASRIPDQPNWFGNNP
ncbi:MAG: extracellular solute-binding protein [Chloroflexota bacterium]